MAVVRLGDKDIELPGALEEGVAPASFDQGMIMPGHGGAPIVSADPVAMGMAAFPGNLSGLTTPGWGMPITGTPIGLPGPPHIPLGAPAGLQKHVMKNRTHMHLPGPTERIHIRVRETPGYSYPRPVHHVRIHEQHIHPAYPFSQPHDDRTEVVH
jgi:hypothetical protein